MIILLTPKVGSRWQGWIRLIAIASMVVAILSTPVLVSVGPSEHEVLESMDGHEETFWGRVSFWPELSMLSNGTPLLGVGYGTYWLGSRLRTIWAKYGWSPTQAHNGYVETYLEVGFIGVALLVWFLLSAGFDAVRGIIREDSSWSALRLAFLLIGTLYNITEAAFKGHHLIWFYLLLLGFSNLLSSAVQPAQLPATGSTGVPRPAWPVFAHWYVRRANVQPYARQSQPPKPLR
jgi:O-antigen ligase